MHVYNGFGLLPDFMGGGSSMTAYTSGIKQKMDEALRIQGEVQPLFSNPIGGPALAGTVKGLEDAISGAWNNLVGAVSALDKAGSAPPATYPSTPSKPDVNQYYYSGGGQRYQDALKAWREQSGGQFKPDPADYQYPGGNGWYQLDLENWLKLQRDNATTRKNQLSDLLDQYVDRVPTAAAAVKKVEAAKVIATVAETEAKSTGIMASTFVAQQNLVAAVKQAAAATAAVVVPKSKLPLILGGVGGVLVLTTIGFFLTRKKKSSGMSGYRKSRKSRKSRRRIRR